MGIFMGHELPGIFFLLVGLWHLFNHIKLYSLNPSSYTSLPWFPTSKLRHFELFLIMIGSSITISMELFIGLARRQPLDIDGTIPSNYLPVIEHFSMLILFFVYALFAIILDRVRAKARHELTFLVGSIAFAQELFLFHLHSTDHHGLEGQYHLLLQIIVVISLITNLLGIGKNNSFMVSFVRSLSYVFQGFWFIVMGIMVWNPSLIPKGCMLSNDDGDIIVKCSDQESLHRAKSLVNIQFSWLLIGITIFAISFYLSLVQIYGKRTAYSSLPNQSEQVQQESGFAHIEKGIGPFDIERKKILEN